MLTAISRTVLKYRDCCVAAALAAVSLLLCMVVYSALQQAESAEAKLFADIKAGTHKYILRQNDICAGEIEVSIVPGTIFELKADGRATVRIGQQDLGLHFRLASFFNPLGQLFRATFAVHSQDSKVSIESERINPLEVRITAESAGSRYDRQLTLPGPLLLQENKAASSFSLEYHPLQSLLRTAGAGGLKPLSLAVVPSQSPAGQCTRYGPVRIESSLLAGGARLFHTLNFPPLMEAARVSN